MDKLTLSLKILTDYLQEGKEYISGGKHRTWQTVVDREQKSFLLFSSGWQNGRYNYCLALHLDRLKDKIYIQRNNTEWLISKELIAKGVAPADIILGYPPFISPLAPQTALQ